MVAKLLPAFFLFAAVGASFASCKTKEPPPLERPLNLGNVPDKYECYPAPSAFYKPGTVVRKRRNTDEATEVEPQLNPKVSLFSPFDPYPSDPAPDYYAMVERRFDGNLMVEVVADILPARGEMRADRKYTVTFSLLDNKELVLDDTSFATVAARFQNSLNAQDPDTIRNHNYFWVKEAIFSGDLKYSILDDVGGKLDAGVDLRPVTITLGLEGDSDATVEVRSEEGVISCVVIEPLQVQLTPGLEGGRQQVFVAREQRSVDSDGTLLLGLRAD